VPKARTRAERHQRYQVRIDARMDAGIERLRALVEQVGADTRRLRIAVRRGATFRVVLSACEDALATIRRTRARTLVLLADSIIEQRHANISNGSRRQNGTQADV